MTHTLFHNSHCLAVDKPALSLSTPSRFASEDQRPCIGRQLQLELGQQIWPVHRLDFEVSGVLLFALSKEAHQGLNSAFERRQVLKTYQALSREVPKELAPGTEVVWQSKIVRGKKRSFAADHGKDATTMASWRQVMCGSSEVAGWTLQPMTGRPHQLRFEMAQHEAPIIGDALYGSKVDFKLWNEEAGRIFLNSWVGIALRAVSLRIENEELRRKFNLPERIEAPKLFASV